MYFKIVQLFPKIELFEMSENVFRVWYAMGILEIKLIVIQTKLFHSTPSATSPSLAIP